jgi:hypothetical protein
LRLLLKWSAIRRRLIEDSALRRALLATADPRVKSGIECHRKTEILKPLTGIPFVLREDRLSGHLIAAICKTKQIMLKIMNPIVAEAWECAALMVPGQPRVKVGSEQTQMSTIALIDTRLTIPGESIGTVVSTLETIQAMFKANEVVKNSSTR